VAQDRQWSRGFGKAGAVSAQSLACPKQARCPGCPLGAEPYQAGLASKGRGLATALGAYTSLLPELSSPRAAEPTLAYRLRAKLVSRGRALGLFERGSHRVVDVAGCRVMSPALTTASDALRDLLPLPVHGADLRETSEGVLVTLLTEQPAARAALQQAGQLLVERGAALSVAVAVRREGDVRLLSGEPEVVVGGSAARHALSAAAPYAYAAHGGFVQAHAGQATYVYAEIARGLRTRLSDTTEPSVLELFAGNGSLALALAKAHARVTAVEAYVPAIALAERAAREQNLALTAVASDATRFMLGQAGRRFDAIVVNPPRRGLDVELRAAIGLAAPRALAYVSCNPHTLARDAAHLQRIGLNLERAEPLDMIPWSDAIEALAWFVPAEPPVPRVLFEDEQLLAVEKAAHEPVLEPDPAQRSLTRSVRSLPGCADAIALEAPTNALSGVCWFAKNASLAARLSGAPAGGDALTERTLLVLARGNLRKQGTITRRGNGTTTRGARYQKQADVGRHSLLRVLSDDADERGALRDFASIHHPVLGDSAHGDAPSNQFLDHRHGLDRAFVHCSASRLHVDADTTREANCDLAPDLARVLDSLGSD
jgi:23S rRNA (uracil1939-C5)-methyltransferase